jgi:hypothetical protein
MALRECTECGGSVSTKAPECPSCGALTQTGKTMRINDVLYRATEIVVLVLIAFLMIGAI